MFGSALRTIAVGLALVGATGFATAGTYDLGTLNNTVAESGIEINGSFDDVFKFTLGSLPGVTGAIAGVDVFGDLYAQYRSGVGSTATWGDWSSLELVRSDADTGAFGFYGNADNLLVGETYWFNIRGNGTQGVYSVTMAPVPEPGTMALVLSGLGLVGAATRRRKNTH